MAYLGIAALLVLSGFFSAAEIALTAVNRLRIERAAQSGDRRARTVLAVMNDFDGMLSTILIGNDLVNIAASSLAAVIAMQLRGPGAVTASGALVTVLILIFGEILPKTTARRMSESFSRMAAPILRVLMTILRPITALVTALTDRIARLWNRGRTARETITEEEFSEILNTVEDEGVLDEETSDLVQSALELDDLNANDVMTPRVEMASIDLDDGEDAIAGTLLNSGYSRIPVWRGTVDHIVGILSTQDYLLDLADAGHCDIESRLRPALFVHQTMKLDDVLRLMRTSRSHLAIVLDEFGGTQGLLTMEDVLEQLVGEIWDERDDVVEEIRTLSENVYEVSGMMPLHEFFDSIDFDEDRVDSEYTTVGGWTIEMLDAQPAVGKSFSFENLTVTVLAMDGLRVDRVRVEVAEPEREEDLL